MKSIARIKVFLFLLIFGVGLYTQRVAIADWVSQKLQPPLPAPIAYEEAKPRAVEEVAPKPVEQKKEAAPAPAVAIDPEPTPVQTQPEPTSTIPASINLAVPFTSQAPTGNWDLPYQEACEESSVLMVHEYYDGLKQAVIDPATAEKELQKIVAFENETFGFYLDTTAEQTGTIAELMYGHEFTLIENPTVDQIKEQLAAGHPVLVPAAGRLLGNPNFHAPGPIYHMLVIRGYTNKNQFITNDPGTRKGQEYVYSFDTIMNAMHDWNGGNEITEG
ncbi:MAG: C39 family peptidase, partial [Patescibacteria group bacterium]